MEGSADGCQLKRSVKRSGLPQAPDGWTAQSASKGIALGPAYHKTDVAAATLRAHEPFAPIRNGRLGTVSLGHFGWVGLDFVAAIFAPDDQPQMRLCGAAEPG